MTSFEVRKIFLDFFKEREHKILPSSSLIPEKDPSLLFVNAGMNQFKPVILGLEKPPAKNVVTIQKCLRAGGKHNDLENVGRTSYHHTFFEMMGNFSFGGYFKQKAISLAWEFLTEKLKLSPENLWVSVYDKDEESYAIWRDEQNIPENKIYQMGEKENFWQMGDTGPCGPCTEIHYYKGLETRPHPGQFMEIWNLVFMEFYDTEQGKREKLSIPCVDTGMGLERLCSILQNEKSNYNTDLFREVIQSLEEASGCSYNFTETSQDEKQAAFRVLADHSRAAAFLIGDGVFPGNEGQSYVLRRILRRAFFFSRTLNPKVNLLQKGAEAVISLMKDVYSILESEAEHIGSYIEREKNQFFETLNHGEKKLFEIGLWTELHELKALHLYKQIKQSGDKERLCEELLKDPEFVKTKISESSIKMKVSNFEFLDTGKGLQNASKRSKVIFNKYNSSSVEKLQIVIAEAQNKPDKKFLDSYIVWHIHSTYGLPLDLIRLIAGERGYHVNLEEVEKIKEKIISSIEKEITQQEQEHSLQSLSQLALKMGCQETEFTGYEKSKEIGQILFKVSPPEDDLIPPERGPEGVSRSSMPDVFSPLKKGQKGWLILDKTCFYPEGGGPIGDVGILKTDTGDRAEVLDCQKRGDFIVHEVEVTEGEGEWKEGQQCRMEVDEKHRRLIKSNHSATHLLHQALRRS